MAAVVAGSLRVYVRERLEEGGDGTGGRRTFRIDRRLGEDAKESTNSHRVGLTELWGEDDFERLREALLRHPWRLPKGVTYLFDWIARMLHQLLHPRPKIPLAPG
jgi:hypothetical protein